MSKRSPSIVLVLASAVALLILTTSSADARFFKWKDETGKLHVDSNPPPEGYDWADRKGVYYNKSRVDGKKLEYVGKGPDPRGASTVNIPKAPPRSDGFGEGKVEKWEESAARSKERIQFGLGDQFLPQNQTGDVIVGMTVALQRKGDGCLEIELESRTDGAILEDIRVQFSLFQDDVYIGERSLYVYQIKKGTQVRPTCEGEGTIVFANGVAVDRMTWSARGQNHTWPVIGLTMPSG